MGHPEHAAAASVDKIVGAEIRFRSSNVPSGVIHDLYDAARAAAGRPLSLDAALGLRDAIAPGETVLVATGSGAAPWLPVGETDGPPGAVGLARALALALDARPVLVTEERRVEALEAVARAGGLNALPYDQLVERRHAASVVPFPETSEEAEDAADRFVDEYEPAAVVAVEKLGPNAEGVIHSITGRERPSGYARFETVFDRAADAGIPTVGVGDGGNELGFGAIEDAVREIQPYGDVCDCPCGGGVATRVAADHVVVAGTSNWGAYGVAAVLALVADAPDALHAPDDERRMLEHAAANGLADGVSARPTTRVDGTSEAANRGVVALLRSLVENRRTEVDRPF